MADRQEANNPGRTDCLDGADGPFFTGGDRLKITSKLGAVYVVNGDGISYSNIADEQDERVLSLHDVRIHVLSDGDAFNPKTRRPAKG